ncbi:MAG TPA: IPT/TIG domain-containing protein [Terriglobales bacterium]|nr:IPT/TIG domain-containing protein [Terriglobales bacterium]
MSLSSFVQHWRNSLRRCVGSVLVASALVPAALAGGPKYVAGASYFDSSVKGVPITWPSPIGYYTDQGSLSPIMPNSMADAYVADAFSRWSAVQTAALAIDQSGHLAEDVNGANVTRDASDNISMPIDIQSSAVSKPIAFVYDADGAVTDALLGVGAGSGSMCFSNTVYGGPDAFTTAGNFAHALVVINGNCIQALSQIADFQYRLIRAVGRVLGLAWSQVNDNVLTGNPPPTSQDYTGFPVMHPSDPISCAPISVCYPNPTVLSMDDEAAISRLYPVTPQNLSSFPSKHPFADTTGRIHGAVWFTDSNGNPIQAMQGVNVVARWVDPVSHQVSRQYAMASVSGFLFTANAGNTITGFTDAKGNRWDRFGSNDTSVEGLFDFAGLEFPDGKDVATYQLTVEAIDTTWSQALEPYGPWQVKPSGSVAPVLVTVTRGGDVQQDLFMTGSASVESDMREPESFTVPAKLPAAGDWLGTLSGYSDADYFWFPGRANRTLSVQVTALDESGAPTEDKARPVIGLWGLASPPGTIPGVATPTAFNATTYGMSALQGLWAAQLNTTANFRLGIADERGDGRPDYAYHARLFYADTITPTRVAAGGGTIVGIRGYGFSGSTSVTMGGVSASVASRTANLVVGATPALPDGVFDVVLADATGASSSMTSVLTYGAGPNDTIVLLGGSNPQVAAGSEAPNPVVVRVLAPDGITPVSGASVYFNTSPAAALSVCGGASSCTVLSDEFGVASTRITPTAAGVVTIEAVLAPASYSSPKRVQTTLSAQTSALDLALLAPSRWVAQGGSVDTILTARVVSYGSPLSGKTVNFQVMMGSANLSSASATSDAHGYASTTVQLRNLSAQVQVSACIGPSNVPCAKYPLNIYPVPLSSLRMEAIAGSAQLVPVGQAFQPVVVRVTDSASPANPVLAATVTFWSIVCRPDNDVFEENGGERGMPVILASTQSVVLSDVSGLASVVPSSVGVAGPIEVEVSAMTGITAVQNFEAESAWMPPGTSWSVARPKTRVYRAVQTSQQNPTTRRWQYNDR